MTTELEELKKKMEEAKIAWKIKFKAVMEKAEFAYFEESCDYQDRFYKYNLNSNYDADAADAALDAADAAYDVFTKTYKSYNKELNKNNDK